MDRLLAWAFIIIVIENQRKWRKSTKNRQKNFASTAFCNIHLSNKTQNQILLPMAQPPRSIYCSTLINPQAHSLVSFHASFIFPKITPTFLRENAHALRKFFIHHGKIMHTLEHSLRLSEVSPTLGYTLSMVVYWEITTYGFSTLRFLIFSRFPSFCPFVAFRLVFPTMTHGCSTDVDHPASPRATRAPSLSSGSASCHRCQASPRATRAPSLGFCCFCFHYSSPPYGSFSHHWYRRTGASFLCH